MDKIKFVMTNTSDIVTEVCREALEAKRRDRDGVRQKRHRRPGDPAGRPPQACLLTPSCRTWTPSPSSSATRKKNSSGVHTTFFVTGAFQSEEVEQDLFR